MTTPEMNDPSGELDRLLSDLPADLPLDEQKFAEDLMSRLNPTHRIAGLWKTFKPVMAAASCE
jgi:hypothetical protein